jgi:hypothetical protein
MEGEFLERHSIDLDVFVLPGLWRNELDGPLGS